MTTSRRTYRRSTAGDMAPARRGFRRLVLLLALTAMTACGAASPVTDAAADAAKAGEAGVAVPHRDAAPDALRPSDLLLPTALGEVKTRFDGTPGRPPLFVIGESHIDLGVQEAVAETLEYLYGAFGVRTVASEGFAGPLPLPPRFGSHAARYAAARADFVGRDINAVEYVALAYRDLHVHGVEDMAAYDQHGAALADIGKRAEAWPKEFKSFIENEVTTLRVSRQDGARIAEALQYGLESGELEGFSKALCQATGTSSGVCRRAEELVREANDLKGSSKAMTSPDHPMMRKRDEMLASNTLRVAGSNPAALVIGFLHLPGVERELRARGVPYLTIVPPGVHKQMETGTMSPEDQEVWTRWKEARPTALEKWLGSEHKPPPALTREGFRKETEVFNALVLADHLLQAGSSEQEVIRLLDRGDFPLAFRVERCFVSDGVHVIEFSVGDERGYALFGDRSPPGTPPPGAKEIKSRKLPGDRHVAIYDGGSGRPPGKVPPTTPPPGDGGPFRQVRVAVERQERENPGAVTIAFQKQGNRLFRFVSGRISALWASPSAVEDLRKKLEELPDGQEKLRAAQKLAAILLMDLDEDLPAGPRSALYQVSDDDMLGSYSLPFLAELAGHPSAERLRAFTEVYAVSPSTRDLEELLVEPREPVRIDRTVVWLSGHFAQDPRYSEVVAAIEAAGAKVNVSPAEGETLVLLGNPERDWTVTLRDAGRRNAGTEAFRADLAKASAVVAISAPLTREDRSWTRRLHAVDAGAEEALEVGRRSVDAIARGSGRESLDQAIRKTASEPTVSLRELLSSRANLSRIGESGVLAAEHATVLSRT